MTELSEAEKALVRSNKPGGQSSPWAMAPLYAAVAAIIDARLAPIRAVLADAEKYDDERLPTCDFYGNRFTTRISQEDLRAALEAASAPVSAQQDHDGTEGQGDGLRTSCGCCDGVDA